MHDGRFDNLMEVLDHYSDGIKSTKFIDSRLNNGISLTSNQKVDLIAFLRSLNDKEFVFNKDFTFPR